MRRLVAVTLLALSTGGAAGAGLAALDACVPNDNRPPPGSLTLTVSPSPAVQHGVTTADGWFITFERVLLGIGYTTLGNGCAMYSEASYDRVLDVTARSGQKLSVVYGIGQCDLRFRIAPPSSDALLGEGVTEAQKTALRTPGADPYVQLGGISIDIEGAAARGDVTKRFHIVFRPRLRYANCTLPPDAGKAVDLRSAIDEVYDIRIEAEAMFRDEVDAAAASLRFEPFALADGDGDGNVTLEELQAVSIASIRDGGAFEASTYELDEDAGTFAAGSPISIDTLGDYVYEVLIPSLPRFRGAGACGVGLLLGGSRGIGRH